MTFSWALEQLKAGEHLARKGWNGKGMFIFLMNGYPEGITANAATAKALRISEGQVIRTTPYIAMMNAQGAIVTGWLASQTDLLADDWEVV